MNANNEWYEAQERSTWRQWILGALLTGGLGFLCLCVISNEPIETEPILSPISPASLTPQTEEAMPQWDVFRDAVSWRIRFMAHDSDNWTTVPRGFLSKQKAREKMHEMDGWLRDIVINHNRCAGCSPDRMRMFMTQRGLTCLFRVELMPHPVGNRPIYIAPSPHGPIWSPEP